jgi:hypothetical protein
MRDVNHWINLVITIALTAMPIGYKAQIGTGRNLPTDSNSTSSPP